MKLNIEVGIFSGKIVELNRSSGICLAGSATKDRHLGPYEVVWDDGQRRVICNEHVSWIFGISWIRWEFLKARLRLGD